MLTQAIGGEHEQIGVVIAGLVHPIPSIADQIRELSGFGRAHLPYRKEYEEIIVEKNIKTVFLYRDPRDAIISHKHWIQRQGEVGHGFMNFEVHPGVRLRDCEDPIWELLKVYGFHYERFLPWHDRDFIHQIKYEDLVTNTVATLENLLEFIGGSVAVEIDCGTVGIMMSRINPETCSTFRKGVIGDWKSEFLEHHKRYFNNHYKEMMKRLGYEQAEKI